MSLSQDLKHELPEATGLTRTNLYYCKKFYLLYNQENIIVPQVGGKLENTAPNKIAPQVGEYFLLRVTARSIRFFYRHRILSDFNPISLFFSLNICIFQIFVVSLHPNFAEAK